jgi:hypothetical protein
VTQVTLGCEQVGRFADQSAARFSRRKEVEQEVEANQDEPLPGP